MESETLRATSAQSRERAVDLQLRALIARTRAQLAFQNCLRTRLDTARLLTPDRTTDVVDR